MRPVYKASDSDSTKIASDCDSTALPVRQINITSPLLQRRTEAERSWLVQVTDLQFSLLGCNPNLELDQHKGLVLT